MDAALDGRMMDLALALATRRLGFVGARPAVGCVIARGGRVLGRGGTGDDGRPHAETMALDEARRFYGAEALRGATAYVTLEPCAHHGRTPPCVDALIAAGIGRVVAALQDPDPRVRGRGFERLRDAGIAVETGLRRAEARAANRGFFTRIARGRPFVTLKLATSLDGRIATAAGESRWITGELARKHVHVMRRRAGAVMVGVGTALADDPLLDVRDLGPAPVAPLRIVADSRLRLPAESRLVATAPDLPLLALHTPAAPAPARRALAAAGVRLAEVEATAEGRVDLLAALEVLGRLEVNAVLVEGGGTLAAGLIAQGLADEIVAFGAGLAIGGDGMPAVRRLPPCPLAACPRFELRGIEVVGPDVMVRWARPDGVEPQA